MPHGKLLSNYKKGQINAFITYGKKKLQIAKPLDRSPTVIRNYLNNQKNYGRQRALSVSCGKIKTDLNLSASRSSILRCLNSVPFIANQKMK